MPDLQISQLNRFMLMLPLGNLLLDQIQYICTKTDCADYFKGILDCSVRAFNLFTSLVHSKPFSAKNYSSHIIVHAKY